MSDCSEVFLLGFEQPGSYWVDPTGANDPGSAVRVWCEAGYTYVLKRGQHDNSNTVRMKRFFFFS